MCTIWIAPLELNPFPTPSSIYLWKLITEKDKKSAETSLHLQLVGGSFGQCSL